MTRSDWFERMVRLRAATETELLAKGYPAGAVRAATKRVWEMAFKWGSALSPEIREQATYELFAAHIVDCEPWCQSTMEVLQLSHQK